MLSWTAKTKLDKSLNEYLLYRLGYGARGDAVRRGLDAHADIEAVLKGRSPVDDRWVSVVDYIVGTLPPIVGVEVALDHAEGITTGRADLICAQGDAIVILDWKTGREYPYHKDQLHYYALAFLSYGIPVNQVGAIYVDAKVPAFSRLRWYELDLMLCNQLESSTKRQIEYLQTAEPQPHLIVPVHGTAADEHTQQFVSQINVEGMTAAIVEEEVETDDGPIVGKSIRILGGDVHIGWIPDIIKDRVKASSCWVFAQFQQTERKHAGLRVAIDITEIDWHGLKGLPRFLAENDRAAVPATGVPA